MIDGIVAVSDQPEFAPVVATWLVGAFGYPGGRTVEQMTALILSPPTGPEQTFVLLAENGKPVGSASVAREDLSARRDLTPLPAGVFVAPAYRQRGNAAALVRRVEAFAMAASVSTLWHYTWTAERL